MIQVMAKEKLTEERKQQIAQAYDDVSDPCYERPGKHMILVALLDMIGIHVRSTRDACVEAEGVIYGAAQKTGRGKKHNQKRHSN